MFLGVMWRDYGLQQFNCLVFYVYFILQLHLEIRKFSFKNKRGREIREQRKEEESKKKGKKWSKLGWMCFVAYLA